MRVDTGVRQGDAITSDYDPMIAKLIVHGADRAARGAAAGRGAGANTRWSGVQTNLGLLRAIAGHPAFAAAELDTGFIARHQAALMPGSAALSAADDRAVWAAAALGVMAGLRGGGPDLSGDPWGLADAWRISGEGYQDLHFRRGGEAVVVRVYPNDGAACRLDLPGGPVTAEAELDGSAMVLRVDGVLHRLQVVRRGSEVTVVLGGRNHVLQAIDPLAPPDTAVAGADRVTAPIPGRVARILVAAGDAVAKGSVLLVLEAMKMELSLVAPKDGVVARISHGVGEMVEEGTELVTFAICESSVKAVQ